MTKRRIGWGSTAGFGAYIASAQHELGHIEGMRHVQTSTADVVLVSTPLDRDMNRRIASGIPAATRGSFVETGVIAPAKLEP